MSVSLIPATRNQIGWLQHTATAYFSELAPGEAAPPLAEIIGWFEDPGTSAMIIMHHQHRVGFALIERLDTHHDPSEFGILRDWRGKGLGTLAVPQCFSRSLGPWAWPRPCPARRGSGTGFCLRCLASRGLHAARR